MNEELNKKLAEWAGLKPYEWRFPSDIHVGLAHPNFTQSLDACFRWLVPKVEDPDIRFEKPVLGGTYWWCYVQSNGIWYGNGGKIPALALCLAIEKLIDGGD